MFVVTYSLTPHARYPTQLTQCVDALRYIIREAGFAPRNVFLGGDSAGANVAMAVLAHVSHHPNLDVLSALSYKDGHRQPSSLSDEQQEDDEDEDDSVWREEYEHVDLAESDEYLGGIFLVGPWVTYHFDNPSEVRNRQKDCLSKVSEAAWAKAYVGEKPPDNWNEPGLAPAEWWKGTRVEEVLVLAGSDEILLDGIEEFVQKLKVCLVPFSHRFVFQGGLFCVGIGSGCFVLLLTTMSCPVNDTVSHLRHRAKRRARFAHC